MNQNQIEQVFKAGVVINNRYEVIKRLGAGGMGAVLLVQDNSLDGELSALKILFPELSEDIVHFARFKNEVILARRISHPNIVKIYDFGSSDKFNYISMEYVEGDTLAKSIYGRGVKKIDFDSSINIILQLTSALSCAHQAGVVHRDLKPDNIMITKEGRVKITDFGLAKATDKDQRFTSTGETVGTPFYMSPEQLAGEVPDERVDIYSLGIMIFEMLTAKRPFSSENYLELAQMHMTQAIPDINSPVYCPKERKQKFPSWAKTLIEKCTEKRRSKRFQSIEEVSEYILENVNDTVREENLKVPLSLVFS